MALVAPITEKRSFRTKFYFTRILTEIEYRESNTYVSKTECVQVSTFGKTIILKILI